MILPLNHRVLMSDVENFATYQAINAFMDDTSRIDLAKARTEHRAIKQAFIKAEIEVIQVPSPPQCQDGVYTANWALVHNNKAVMSRLPNARQAEQAYAKDVLSKYVDEIIFVPDGKKFSGQGDALICGDYLFIGSNYRTDEDVHDFVANSLGLQLIGLQTIPKLDDNNQPKINDYSGWPDSYFYDIDLALAIIKNPGKDQKGLIAWCPDAFTQTSQNKLRAFDRVDKIEVSMKEAKTTFACNLVSTGKTVIMSAYADELKYRLEKHGLEVLTPDVTELAKGGGYIRCTSLAI